jgi:NAD(P)-dependent dehydrogenase (short-subunit alcohol dehydrogenase family)
MDLELRNKSILITGASKGIGFACAAAFAAEGCRLHLAARDAAMLEAARAKLAGQHGVEVSCHPYDLGVAANAVKLARECGDIDVLVNNAGAIPAGTIDQVGDEKWRHAWDLKVFGYINLAREVYAGMRARGSGVIVNVIGMAGERNRPEYIAGSSGNAALMAFSRALGAESVDHGIRVVGVNPGRIQTERQVEAVMDAAERKLGDRARWQEMMTQMASKAPFKRFGRPDEVADLVVYLASARASYISATVVNIDAGQSLRPA